jgi:hypothetical protein
VTGERDIMVIEQFLTEYRNLAQGLTDDELNHLLDPGLRAGGPQTGAYSTWGSTRNKLRRENHLVQAAHNSDGSLKKRKKRPRPGQTSEPNDAQVWELTPAAIQMYRDLGQLP